MVKKIVFISVIMLMLCACSVNSGRNKPTSSVTPVTVVATATATATVTPTPTPLAIISTPTPTPTPTPSPKTTAKPTQTPTTTKTPIPARIETDVKKPSIRIDKSERKLYLYDEDKIVGEFPVGLGFAPEGDKEREGDGKTPTGSFYLCTRNSNSRFYLSLGVSYPSKDDAEKGLKDGLVSQSERDKIVKAIEKKVCPPWDTGLGGEIMIHGGGAERDWTLGCIALANEDIDVIWKHCKTGTKITIEE